MKAQEAADILNSAAWRPGMEIRARVVYTAPDLPIPELEVIQVEVIFHTYDSSWPDDDGQYRVPRSIAPQGMLPVGDMDEEALLFAVLRMVAQAHEHEDREFLRVRKNGKWVAPFHPHNDDTDRLWERLVSKTKRVTAWS